ncbi:MAG: preprotein translocase subunit YajC [Desulfobacterales bacterium]|nr:preprotein translocase subunit YajC [Desulfobacterales bacterium]
MLVSTAYAMGAQGGAGGPQSALGGFVPLILMFVIFYFLLIRPQQKKAKAHQEMINAIKKGDKVITSGGIHGIVVKVDETTATIEIAEKVNIKVIRANIAAKI